MLSIEQNFTILFYKRIQIFDIYNNCGFMIALQIFSSILLYREWKQLVNDKQLYLNWLIFRNNDNEGK